MCMATCARVSAPSSDAESDDGDDDDDRTRATRQVCGACGLESTAFTLTPNHVNTHRVARFVANVRAAIAQAEAAAAAINHGDPPPSTGPSATATPAKAPPGSGAGLLGAMPGAALLALPVAAARMGATMATPPATPAHQQQHATPTAGGPPPPPDYATTMKGVTVASTGPAWKTHRREWLQ